jgi:hypothetical protein
MTVGNIKLMKDLGESHSTEPVPHVQQWAFLGVQRVYPKYTALMKRGSVCVKTQKGIDFVFLHTYSFFKKGF